MRTDEEHGFARYTGGKFSLSYDGEVVSPLPIDDPTNRLVIKSVVVGAEGKMRYDDLRAENFLDYKQLRDFNAGKNEPDVKALVDIEISAGASQSRRFYAWRCHLCHVAAACENAKIMVATARAAKADTPSKNAHVSHKHQPISSRT